MAAARSSSTSDAEERTKLWKARHDAYWSSLTLRPGAKGLSTDVCVPISRLAECIAATEADIAEHGLIAPIVGHVGDGNFHVLVLMDVDDPKEIEATESVRRAAQHARHRHGRHLHRRARHRPGQDRLHRARASAPALDIMRTIKRALDPLDILNPGKILSHPRRVSGRPAANCHFIDSQMPLEWRISSSDLRSLMLARLFVIFGGLFVLALTAALVGAVFYRLDRLPRRVRARGQRHPRPPGHRRGRRHRAAPAVPLGHLHECLVAGGPNGQPAMTVETFSMDAELAPFLRGEVLIFDMRLVRPKLTYRHRRRRRSSTGRCGPPRPSTPRRSPSRS